MGITQNKVVWIKIKGGGGGGGVNFAMIAKFRYHRENYKHSENLNFRYAQQLSL